VAEMDTGVSIGTLVRVSHIHLFGLTFIFFIMASFSVMPTSPSLDEMPGDGDALSGDLP